MSAKQGPDTLPCWEAHTSGYLGPALFLTDGLETLLRRHDLRGGERFRAQLGDHSCSFSVQEILTARIALILVSVQNLADRYDKKKSTWIVFLCEEEGFGNQERSRTVQCGVFCVHQTTQWSLQRKKSHVLPAGLS